MRAVTVFVILGMLSFNASASDDSSRNERLIEPLRPYVKEVLGELDTISQERRDVLNQIAGRIATRLELGDGANLTFICSHNSRRSHMSQLWAQTAAHYFGLGNIQAFSGGTEATACNARTVTALRNVGFSVVQTTEGDNPKYLIQYSDDCPPILAYSKLYNADGNPHEDFMALMCCSKADKQCPKVEGASSRFAIHYIDPKECDDTPEERAAYADRCREIAREMFYIMSGVAERLELAGTQVQ